MPLERVTSDELSRDDWIKNPETVTIARYERELAAARIAEGELRAALALKETLLEQKDELIRHQEILNRETHHRLMNNLQMIVSLLSLQSRKEANAEASARLSVAANRVGAIARLHRHLHSMDNMATTDFRQYLDELCRDHSTMSTSEERPNQDIAVEGVDLSLTTAIAIPLGLVANELVTNALKHGEGRITVRLAPHPGQGYALSVSNKGRALPEGFDPTDCSGLGMSLVATFVKQIGGELRIDRGDDNDCTRFTVLFAA